MNVQHVMTLRNCALVLLVGAATACGSNGTGASAPQSQAPVTSATDGADTSGPLIRLPKEPDSDEEYAMEISGVVLVENDCVLLRNDEVQRTALIVWPAFTVWDATTDEVVLPDGDRLGHGGTYFAGGAGYSFEGFAPYFTAQAQAIAQRCLPDTDGSILVVRGLNLPPRESG